MPKASKADVLWRCSQWEIFCTLEGGKELHIALSPAQHATFQEALVRGRALLVRCLNAHTKSYSGDRS